MDILYRVSLWKVFMKFPKPKKVKKTTLRNKADKLFSQRIRMNGVCVAYSLHIRCGGALQCAHIISRANMRLRYDYHNAIPLCMAHHRWFHQHPFEFVEFIKTSFPLDYAYVMAHKDEKVKKTEDLYRGVIARFEGKKMI